MTTVDYAALLNAAEKATPTEWHYSRKHEDAPIHGPSYEIGSAIRGVAGQMHVHDAAYIVAAQPSTILQVCADRKALLDRIEALEKALRPFASLVPAAFDDGYEDADCVNLHSQHGPVAVLRVIDFRLARTTLSGAQP